MSKPDEILRFHEQLKSRRRTFDVRMQEVIDYILPFNADINGVVQRQPGAKKTDKIFDGSAGYGLHIFSQFVQGSIFNPGQKWFGLQHRDQNKNKSQGNAAWLNGTREKMLREMRTTFYAPGGQAINSWAGFGNGPLLCEDVPQKRDGLSRMRYTSIPWGQWVAAEGFDGKIDQFIRCIPLTAKQIMDIPGADPSSDVRNAVEKEPFRLFEVLHSILPRDFQTYSKDKAKSKPNPADMPNGKVSKIKYAKDLPFASCWVEVAKKKLIKESGYRKFPVAIARMDLISGEVYARGLGEAILPDAKSLNLADQKALLKWDRELDPPTTTLRNSIVGKILDKRAGGNTVVSRENAVRPLFDNSNWQAHDLMAKRKEEAILRICHVNEILNLLAREKPEMTAFEVNARLTLLQQILGPVFGIIESEFLSVIVDVTLDNMAWAGMLDDPPEEISVGASGKDILDVVYEGPLARAQRNGEIIAIQQSAADVAGMQPFYPEVTQLVDWQKMARKLFEIRGNQELLVDEEEFTKAVNEMIEQQNAEKAAALVAGGAQALGQAAPGLKVLREQATGQVAA